MKSRLEGLPWIIGARLSIREEWYDETLGKNALDDFPFLGGTNESLVESLERKTESMWIEADQMEDGGFKYDATTEKASLYYGKKITPDGYIGSIHATTLFSMAMALIDNYMEYDMKLVFATS